MRTAQRLSRVIGGIAVLGVLVIAAMVTWSVLHRADPGPALPLAGGPALGDLTGYVGRVDRDAGTVDVADDLFGLRPVMLVVTDDTSIMVHGKEGALGDLSKDMPVRVFYEVRDDVKYVTSLQVISDGAQASGPTAADVGPVVEDRAGSPVTARPGAEPTPAARTRAPVAAVVPPAPAAPSAAAAIGPPRASPRPADAEVGDGSAAIDWLFESRRR